MVPMYQLWQNKTKRVKMSNKVKNLKELLYLLENSSACVCSHAVPFIKELVKENKKLKRELEALKWK
jgi:uncharacterized protein (UPF0218 family)